MITVTDLSDGCIECNICVNECAFLSRYGTPGKICTFQQTEGLHDSSIFACNLCGLCNTVCPKKIDVTGAFLDIRRDLQRRGGTAPATSSIDSRHQPICAYEKTGGSTLFSLHRLPEGCDTVFFPGCTLTATRSIVTMRTYSHLQTVQPNCGIILDCCGKPSHDLGLDGNFQPRLSRLANSLKAGGIKKIITACPSCHVTFRKYLPQCITRTIYEELIENPPPRTATFAETVTVHDSCTARNSPEIHEAVRTLLTRSGASITEARHSRDTALCCGEGAAASFISPELAGSWKTIRKQEAHGNRVITYCAGCAGVFGKDMQTTHLLDLLFDHDRALEGKEQKTRSPFTYLRRLLLKWRISRRETAGNEPAGLSGLPGRCSLLSR